MALSRGTGLGGSGLSDGLPNLGGSGGEDRFDPTASFAPGANSAWDFINNYARFKDVYYGALANTPNWTFTRASTGYAQTSGGVLQSFASGELRRTDKGVFIEGARTNLCLQSQTFDNASWTKSRSSVSANAVAAPDGTTTADKLVEDSATGTHRVYQRLDKAASAITYTASVYLKSAERTFASVKMMDGVEANGAYVGINLTTGELTAVGITGFTTGSARATSLANGWWRLDLTATTDTAVFVTMFVQTATVLIPNQSYTGDGASGLYLWGAQLEATAYASSYIPTTTASATRAADVLTVPVSGIDYPLSLFAEFERSVDTGGTEMLVEISNNTSANYLRLFVNSSDQGACSVNSGSVSQGGVAVTGAVALATPTRVAARMATNSIQTARGGSLGTEDTTATAPAAPTHIHFGQNEASGNPLFGYLRRAAIFSRALSDGELQALTAA